MSRVRRCRTRERAGRLSFAERMSLTVGSWRRAFEDDPAGREAAWWAHRDELLDAAAGRGSGRRPEAFWQYEVADPALWPRIDYDPRPFLAERPGADALRAHLAATSQAAARLRFLAENGLLTQRELAPRPPRRHP